MKNKVTNPVLFLQIHAVNLYMERHKMTVKEFLALDAEKDILGYLREGYEIFHLSGDGGIMEELDAYVSAIK